MGGGLQKVVPNTLLKSTEIFHYGEFREFVSIIFAPFLPATRILGVPHVGVSHLARIPCLARDGRWRLSFGINFRVMFQELLGIRHRDLPDSSEVGAAKAPWNLSTFHTHHHAPGVGMT